MMKKYKVLSCFALWVFWLQTASTWK